jgi:hypothetical protein
MGKRHTAQRRSPAAALGKNASEAIDNLNTRYAGRFVSLGPVAAAAWRPCRREDQLTKEALSICRRDVRKLISVAMEEGAAGDWGTIEDHFVRLVARIPRTPTTAELEPILEEMKMLRDEIVNLL